MARERVSFRPHHRQPPHHRLPHPHPNPILNHYHWPALPQVDRHLAAHKGIHFPPDVTHNHQLISHPNINQPSRPHILDHHYDPNPKKPFKIYFEHFPSEWDSEALKWVFSQYGKVLDVYVPKKLTRKGDRFGFAEFEGRQNEDNILARVKGIWIGSYNLRANKVRFSRAMRMNEQMVDLKQTSKQVSQPMSDNSIERVANGADKMLGLQPSICAINNLGRVQHSTVRTEERSLRYADVVKGEKRITGTEDDNQMFRSAMEDKRCLIEYQSLQEDKDWLEGSAVGILWQNALIQEMRDFINTDDSIECYTTPMGGKLILLTFSSKADMQKTLALKPEWLSRWFENVDPWKAPDVSVERYAWLKCEGLPLHAWNPGMLMMLGNLVGDAVSLDKSTAEKLRLDAARILIATSTTTKIDRVVNVAVDGVVYPIKITEDPSDGPWCGRFQYAKNRDISKSNAAEINSESETREDPQTGRFDALKGISDDYYDVEVETCIPNTTTTAGGGADQDRRSFTAGKKPNSNSKFKSAHDRRGKKVNATLPSAVTPEGEETLQNRALEMASDAKSVSADFVGLKADIVKGQVNLGLRHTLSPNNVSQDSPISNVGLIIEKDHEMGIVNRPLGYNILPTIGLHTEAVNHLNLSSPGSPMRNSSHSTSEVDARKAQSDPGVLRSAKKKRRYKSRRSGGSETNSDGNSFPPKVNSSCLVGYSSAVESGKRKKKQSFKRKLIRKKSKFPQSTLKYNLILALMQKPTRRKIRRISNIMQADPENNLVADNSISDGGIANMNNQVRTDTVDSVADRHCESGSARTSVKRRRREAKKTWKIGKEIGLSGKVCDLDIQRNLELLIEREEREWRVANQTSS